MRHPALRIRPEEQAALFRWGVAASALVGLPLLIVVELGPGLVSLGSLVFAGTSGRADAVLEGWSTSDRLSIAFANGLDYLFGVLLFGTLAIGCAAASRSSSRTGAVLVWLATIAIVLDVPENVAYLVMLRGETSAPWPQLAFVASAPRFAVFFACAAYIAVAALRDRGR